jgi:hypothetical protein
MVQQDESIIGVRRRRLALFAGLAAASGCLSQPAERRVRELDPDEMAEIEGGVAANITFPSSNSMQTFDNLRFTASVQAGSPTNDVTVGVFAGATKVGEQTLDLPGTWDRRTRWPLPGGHSAQFKVIVDGEWFDASGDSLRTNVSLHPSVHVYGVRLRGLNAGINSTPINPLVSEQIDATAPATPTSTSNTIDGIYGQCGGSNKVQWRHIDSQTITTTAACSDLGALTDACPPATCDVQDWNQCPALMACLNNVYLPEAMESTDAYVFHVKSVPCHKEGQNVGFNPPGSDPLRSFVLLDADNVTDPTFYTALLAHELGHAFSAAHCDSNNPDDQCSPTDCPGNLMCELVGGRSLTAGQCLGYTGGLHWTDRND